MQRLTLGQTTGGKKASKQKSNLAQVSLHAVKTRKSRAKKEQKAVSGSAKTGISTKDKSIKRIERVKVKKGHFTNKYRFKFGWTPFPSFTSPPPDVYREVCEILRVVLAKEDIIVDGNAGQVAGAPQGPMHVGDDVTVDALVKVMMSQATNNSNALAAQARLVRAFPYEVDGKKIIGKVPNYHDVRVAPNEELAAVLETAGLHYGRSKQIQACLQAIFDHNVAQLDNQISVKPGNQADAHDFVPGLLSMDYLQDMTKEQKFDCLLSLPGIGVKSAACILAFNYRLPVFAVDTHIHRIVRSLGWVPESCTANDACAHLDNLIPDDIKYALHQAFWHHGQRCLKCKARNNEKVEGWESAICPIEQYVQNRVKKERKASPKKRKTEDSGSSSEETKAAKGNKTMVAFAKMTADEAAAKGYEAEEYVIEDSFGVKGTNITGSKKVHWIKKVTTVVKT